MKTPTESLPRPVQAIHQDGFIHVKLSDGKALRFPVSVSPRLAAASASERGNIELLPFTLHWPDVDEDLTIESLFVLGYGD